MAYSSLGYSVPDLRITGSSGTVASWGGPLDVTALIQNTGASTMVEPLSLVPASQVTLGPDLNNVPPYYTPSQADAPNTQVSIYLTPRRNTLNGAILIGAFTVPSIPQNDITQISTNSLSTPLVLPQHPVGFPSSGVYYLRLVVNGSQSVPESNYANNTSPAIPIRILNRAPLPQLVATALDVPASLAPGDTIAPTFQITNFGTASTASQGSVQVALVASTSPDFNAGVSQIALYTLDQSIPAQSSAATRVSLRHHRRLYGTTGQTENAVPGLNVATFTGDPVTLPISPGTYYIGLVIDPNNTLQQLSTTTNRLQQVRKVGPATSGQAPAGVVSTPLTEAFPNPADGVAIGTVNTSAL